MRDEVSAAPLSSSNWLSSISQVSYQVNSLNLWWITRPVSHRRFLSEMLLMVKCVNIHVGLSASLALHVDVVIEVMLTVSQEIWATYTLCSSSGNFNWFVLTYLTFIVQNRISWIHQNLIRETWFPWQNLRKGLIKKQAIILSIYLVVLLQWRSTRCEF